MRIERIVLCYADGDKIIIRDEEDLSRYDLSKVKSYEVEASLSPDEFVRFRAMNQTIASTAVVAAVQP